MAELVTIVIPVHNRRQLVGRTLQSVAAQTVAVPVVLVDNGSTDGSGAVLRQWAAANGRFAPVVVDAPTPGAGAARNAGLAQVQTPYTLFFDSDDEMLPRHIERVVAGLQAHGDADIVGWDTTLLFADGHQRTGRFATANAIRHALFHGGMATQRWAARTSLLRAVGGWHTSLPRWNDIELGLRLLTATPAPLLARLEGAPTVRVHVHADSLTGTGYYTADHRVEQAIAAFGQALQGRDEAAYLPLLKAIYAGHYAREGHMVQSLRLRAEALEGQPFWRRERIYAAYWHTRIGLPGAARIYV